MTTAQDRELLEALTQLNTTITTFSMDLVARKLDRDAHITLALMLLDRADRVLRRMSEDQQDGTGGL